MRRIRAWLRIVGVVLALSYFLSRLLMLNAVKGFSTERGFKFRRKFTAAALGIFGVKWQIQGEVTEGPKLYVSNHRSMLDPFINLNHIDAVIVSKAEVASYPLVGRGARATGVIFVERDKGSSRNAAREAIRAALEEGSSVLIYPEGTTSSLETTREFKPGSFAIAALIGVPVVPVAIEYKDPSHRWHEGGLLPFFLKKFSKKQIRAAMRIGKPIVSDDPRHLLNSSERWIGQQLREMQREFEV